MKNLFHSLNMGITCPIYLFHGEEQLLMEEAISKLTELVAPGDDAWNKEVIRGDEISPDEAAAAGQNMGFFSSRRLIIIRDIPWLNKKPADTEEKDNKSKTKTADPLAPLTAYATDPNPDSILVLTMRNAPDKRRKLVQTIAKTGRVVEFSPLKGGEREIWLKNYFKKCEKSIDNAAISYICVNCSDGLAQLKLEADKLILYAKNTSQITKEMAELVISKSSLSGIFDMTDAAATKKAAEACAIYRELLLHGEAEQKILAMLATQYRNMLAIKDITQRGESLREAATMLSIHPFVAEKCAQAGRKYTIRQLIKALEILLATDIAQKTGQGNIRDGLELAIIRICQM